MGVFTAAEFNAGFKALNVTSVAELKALLPALRARLDDTSTFNRIWMWLYDFNCEAGQKTIALAAAIAVTQLVMTPARWPLAPAWVSFLSRPGMKGSVSKDTWSQLLRLRSLVKSDLSNYEAASDAWPVLLDDFVEWQRAAERAVRQ